MEPSAQLHLALAVAAAGPLLYAAASKLLEPSHFAAAMHRFNLVFLRPSPRLARFIGVLEISVGGALVLSPSSASALIGTGVYVGFGLVLVRAIRDGSAGDCGCFGALEGRIDAGAVLRNVAVGIGCLSLAVLRHGELLAVYDLAMAALALVVVTLAAAAADTLLAVRKRTV